MNVMIDGLEYVPKAEIPELTDERLKKALRELTAMLYFRETHKSMAHAWDTLNALAPELAKLSPEVAYDRMHKDKTRRVGSAFLPTIDIA
jgi:hypothetical protein